MIEEQAGVEVVAQIDEQLAAAFVDAMELAGVVASRVLGRSALTFTRFDEYLICGTTASFVPTAKPGWTMRSLEPIGTS